MITLIRQRPWQSLIERLDAIVAADATLLAARGLVVAPVTLLARIAEDVEGALGDDPLALERLRALLSLSAIHALRCLWLVVKGRNLVVEKSEGH